MTRISAFITVALFVPWVAQAQSVTYWFNDGTLITHSVTDIRSTTIDDSNMYVSLMDGTTYTWSHTSLMSYDFTDISTATPAEPIALSPLLVYPNPASDGVWVGITAARKGRTSVDILDLRGGVVRSLVDGTLSQGEQLLSWDGRNANGQRVAAGTYLVRVVQGPRVATHQVIVQQ